MDATATPAPAPPTRTLAAWLRDMPRWKKALLAAAGVALVAGAVLTLVSPAPPPPPAGAATAASPGALAAGLVTDGASTTSPPAEEPAAKGVFRLGFSFIAGFCIGSFLRATLRIASIAFGFWLLMTIVLAYFGLVVVDWHAIDALWSRFTTNVAAEWGSFQRFMTGSLPAAGLVTAGLAVGLKRH
jgi:uncharacterized membrane protein (Fun14 family)